jgi:hypothetical protein
MKIDSVLHYPELYDKTYNVNFKRPEPEPMPGLLLQPCITSFIRGQCANGHFYAKALVCGKEWCPDCGRDDSIIHKRRQARWWGKVMQMRKVGYLVLTIPEELREEFKNKKALQDLRKYVTRKLKRMGYARGLQRYHWAGDCPICRGHGCKICAGTGCDTIYKPHLNVLIEEGFISKLNGAWESKIDLLKNDLVTWFNTNFKETLKANNMASFKGNVFYSYCGLHKKTKTDKPHRIHKLKYITRSTFRHYQPAIAELLKGFRTTSTWGKWKKCEQPITSELVSLEQGLCPHCLKEEGIIEKLTWGGFINIYDFIRFKERKQMEGGYFYLNSS